MRVALDFSWPLHERWQGYLNPYRAHQCAFCKGSGQAERAKLFSDQWYGKAPFDPVAYGAKPLTLDHPAVQAFALRNVERTPSFYGFGAEAVRREALRLFDLWKTSWSHHLIQADVDALLAANRLSGFKGKNPTADEVNAWSIGGFGHDAINQWVCVKARCKRENVPVNCKKCNGSGESWPSPEFKKAHDKWKETEPPAGPGFQLWETTSEGSPVSPVFKTLDELCAWAEDNASTFGSNKTTAAEWKRMLEADFVVHREGNSVFL